MKEIKHNGDTFEVVNDFPKGYEIWNIGRHNFPFECYVPLARPLAENRYYIDRASLKAIKVDDEQTALAILKEAGRRTVNETKYYRIIAQYNH